MSGPAGRRLVVTSAAATDLTDAHDWYEAQSTGLGAEFLRAVDAVLATVQRSPATFPTVHGRTRRALLGRFPYGVFFIETGSDVVVLAVVHSAGTAPANVLLLLTSDLWKRLRRNGDSSLPAELGALGCNMNQRIWR